MGESTVSRAFGDRLHKRTINEILGVNSDSDDDGDSSDADEVNPRSLPLLIADPEVVCLDLEGLADKEPLFVLLASCGLWDVFSQQEACEFVAKELDKNGADCAAALKELTNTAVNDLGCAENVTALMVMLKPWAGFKFDVLKSGDKADSNTDLLLQQRALGLAELASYDLAAPGTLALSDDDRRTSDAPQGEVQSDLNRGAPFTNDSATSADVILQHSSTEVPSSLSDGPGQNDSIAREGTVSSARSSQEPDPSSRSVARSSITLDTDIHSFIKNLVCQDGIQKASNKGVAQCCRYMLELKSSFGQQKSSSLSKATAANRLLIPQLAAVIIQARFRAVLTRRRVGELPPTMAAEVAETVQAAATEINAFRVTFHLGPASNAQRSLLHDAHQNCARTCMLTMSLPHMFLRLESKFADIEGMLLARGPKYDQLLRHIKGQLIVLRELQDDAKVIKLAKSIESQIDQLNTLAVSLPELVVLAQEQPKVLAPLKNIKKGSFLSR